MITSYILCKVTRKQFMEKNKCTNYNSCFVLQMQQLISTSFLRSACLIYSKATGTFDNYDAAYHYDFLSIFLIQISRK